MSSDCIFCRIVSGEIPAKRAHETETVLAFHDINPQAPTHVLLIPKAHIGTINDLAPDNVAVMGDLLLTAKAVAHELGVDQTGYRLIFNCGADAGMEVSHIHLHLLAGRKMTWPPG